MDENQDRDESWLVTMAEGRVGLCRSCCGCPAFYARMCDWRWRQADALSKRGETLDAVRVLDQARQMLDGKLAAAELMSLAVRGGDH